MNLPELILYLVIVCGVGLFMLGIGIWQLCSKQPVGFYAGEEPPKPAQLTDVNKWNKKHGAMWTIYGVAIILSGLSAVFMGDSFIHAMVVMAVIMLGVPVMIFYHTHLKKKYLKNE